MTAAVAKTLTLPVLTDRIVACRACPRLRAHCLRTAQIKRASYRHDTYWGRPIPNWAPPDPATARLLVIGLAPAAHGGNRTGRVFTGDRSGDWLYRALWKQGFANQPTSVHLNDGLVLSDAYVAAAVRCAPPANKPTPVERDRCVPYLVRELALLTQVRVVVALGQFAHDAVWRLVGAGARRPPFGHLAEHNLPNGMTLLDSFHPSQQNTFTGKLTEPAFDAVFTRAGQLVRLPRTPPGAASQT